MRLPAKTVSPPEASPTFRSPRERRRPRQAAETKREAREGRDGEVVGGQRRDARELRLRRGEQVTPVVVVDRGSRHPGVGGRHRGIAREGVQEREVHEFLGADHRRPDGADDQHDAGRGPEEDRGQLLLVAPGGRADRRGFVRGAAPSQPRDARDAEHDDDQHDAPESRRVQQKRERPGQVRDDGEPERPREQRGIPTVAEVGAKHRENGEAQDLRRQGPCQNVPHAAHMHCRRAASCTKLAPRKRMTVEKRRTLRNPGRGAPRAAAANPERASDRIPFRVRPMLATLVDEPFHRPGWVYEEKYDGYRILAYKEGSGVTLLSAKRARPDVDIRRDRRGRRPAARPDPAARRRSRGLRPASRLPVSTPAAGLGPPRLRRLRRPVPQRPRPAARAALREAGRARRRRAGSASRRAALAEARPRTGSPHTGSPGNAASRASSPRTPRRHTKSGEHSSGSRSRSTRRTSSSSEASRRRAARASIWAPSSSARYRGRELRFVGKVGTGFSGATLESLSKKLRPLVRAKSPFVNPPREKDATWLAPKLVGADRVSGVDGRREAAPARVPGAAGRQEPARSEAAESALERSPAKALPVADHAPRSRAVPRRRLHQARPRRVLRPRVSEAEAVGRRPPAVARALPSGSPGAVLLSEGSAGGAACRTRRRRPSGTPTASPATSSAATRKRSSLSRTSAASRSTCGEAAPRPRASPTGSASISIREARACLRRSSRRCGSGRSSKRESSSPS